jgi:hypothetical protein
MLNMDRWSANVNGYFSIIFLDYGPVVCIVLSNGIRRLNREVHHMGFYLKRVVERETPQLQADRLRLRTIVEQATRERDSLWPVITVDNVVQAAKWHEDRISQLLREAA